MLSNWKPTWDERSLGDLMQLMPLPSLSGYLIFFVAKGDLNYTLKIYDLIKYK